MLLQICIHFSHRVSGRVSYVNPVSARVNNCKKRVRKLGKVLVTSGYTDYAFKHHENLAPINVKTSYSTYSDHGRFLRVDFVHVL